MLFIVLLLNRTLQDLNYNSRRGITQKRIVPYRDHKLTRYLKAREREREPMQSHVLISP